MKREVVLVWVALTATILWGELLYSFDAGSLPLTIGASALFGAAGTAVIIAALYVLDSVMARVIAGRWIKEGRGDELPRPGI